MTSVSRRQQVGWLASVSLVAGLSIALAGATPMNQSHDSSIAAAHAAKLTAASKPASTLAEFSRPSARQFSPPPINEADYQLCLQKEESIAARVTFPLNAYMSGYSNAQKQNGSAPAGFPTPSFVTGITTNITSRVRDPTGELFTCAAAWVNLDYHGKRELPPITATFLAFGFVPVTATVVLEQQGPDPLLAVLYEDNGRPGQINIASPFFVAITARLELRVTNVRVNGARINVGPSCHTDGILNTPGNPVSPGELMLTGGGSPGNPVPIYQRLLTGGAVAGLASIPQFTDCITPAGENLDPLLTSTVSGTGNYVQVVQDPPCFNLVKCRDGNLPPNPPPLYSVTHGGRYSASGGFSIFDNFSTVDISCDASHISGAIPNTFGPLRGPLATIQWEPMDSCSDGNSTWQVTPQKQALFGGDQFCDALTPPIAGVPCTPNAFGGTISDISFLVKNKDSGCEAELSGYIPASYLSPGGLLESPTDSPENDFVVVNSSNCPELPTFTQRPGILYGVGVQYHLQPSGITVRPLIP